MQSNKKYIPYIYDGHGHSNASDGLHTPEVIIDKGLEKGLSIIGLSDHNIITNLPRFLAYADKINKNTQRFLAVPSIEISTQKGDVIVVIPGRNQAENFIAQYKKPPVRLHPYEIVEDYIDRYNAIIIIPHPDTQYINSFSLQNIEKLLKVLPKKYHANIGIEIYNWMSQAFFWNRAKRENNIYKENNFFQLAPFSFTDYHSAYHIGSGSTLLYMEDLTPQSFIDAIQNRRTAPYNISNRGIVEFMKIVKATVMAEGMSRFSQRPFHVPKK